MLDDLPRAVLAEDGKIVADGPAAVVLPACEHSNDRPIDLVAQRDVTRFLTKGDNCLADHVYYHGLATRAFNSADNRSGLVLKAVVRQSRKWHLDFNARRSSDD